jgi:hypothetical protein
VYGGDEARLRPKAKELKTRERMMTRCTTKHGVTAQDANPWVGRPKIRNLPYAIPVLMLVAAGILRSQTLSLSAPPVVEDSEVVVQVLLKAPPGKQPSALEWEFRIPPGLAPNEKGAAAGESASAAGKTLICNFAGKKETGTCILAGGDRPIQDGPVAHLTMRVTEDRHPLVLRITRASAASRDAKGVEIPAVELQLKRRD